MSGVTLSGGWWQVVRGRRRTRIDSGRKVVREYQLYRREEVVERYGDATKRIVKGLGGRDNVVERSRHVVLMNGCMRQERLREIEWWDVQGWPEHRVDVVGW